jgi:hypothetical protein
VHYCYRRVISFICKIICQAGYTNDRCNYVFLRISFVYIFLCMLCIYRRRFVMFYLFRKLRQYYHGRECRIFIISFLVYVIINMFENYIHYNIGKNQESWYQIEFSSPSQLDWAKIAIVMLVFALLQGIFTIIIERYLGN